MDELDWEWEVEDSEMLRLWRNSWKTLLSFWEMKCCKGSKQTFELFILISKILPKVARPQFGLNQRHWWHLGNTNQEHSAGYRYSSTAITFTRVTQEPKVMSPQSFPRDVRINCGITIDQTSWWGNLSFRPKLAEHSRTGHSPLQWRTRLVREQRGFGG